MAIFPYEGRKIYLEVANISVKPISPVVCSAGCETPAGGSGRLETPERCEEAQAPPRGKRTPGTEDNREFTTDQNYISL
ncbi:hypothetical protein AB685_04575 [Bacillus sp. LL01]|nr:hypothetical protein AB685_04575 [Bacillus sp. LL01]